MGNPHQQRGPRAKMPLRTWITWTLQAWRFSRRNCLNGCALPILLHAPEPTPRPTVPARRQLQRVRAAKLRLALGPGSSDAPKQERATRETGDVDEPAPTTRTSSSLSELAEALGLKAGSMMTLSQAGSEGLAQGLAQQV